MLKRAWATPTSFLELQRKRAEPAGDLTGCGKQPRMRQDIGHNSTRLRDVGDIVAHSKDYLVGFKWRGDDRLVPILDFGCAARLSDPVRRVDPVEILYWFDRTIILLRARLQLFPREGPARPCHTRRDLIR